MPNIFVAGDSLAALVDVTRACVLFRTVHGQEGGELTDGLRAGR
jgi:hypothetical protein